MLTLQLKNSAILGSVEVSQIDPTAKIDPTESKIDPTENILGGRPPPSRLPQFKPLVRTQEGPMERAVISGA